MKPVIHVLFLVLFLSLAAMAPAQSAGSVLTWTRTDGQVIQAGFLRLEGDAVVVLRGGNELTIPFSMLASDALRQAKELGKQSSEPADVWQIRRSLDADYRETDRTFLITLQPSGRKFARIDCPVTRDGQRRLTTLTLPGGTLKFAYDAEGIAHLAKDEP